MHIAEFALAPQPMTVAAIPALSGFGSIRQTLGFMREFTTAYRANPVIRRLALNIVRNLPPKDKDAEASALLDWVRSNVRYVPDVLDTETLATPTMTLDTAGGDCDDMSTLLASLLESIGFRTRFVVTGYHLPGEYEHVFLQALVNGDWLSADPTEALPLGQEPAPPVARYTEDMGV